ncbi:hypothetical protein Tco_0242697 [Tanacetum coccineum]
MTYSCHWFSEQVGLAGDVGSTNDVLISLIIISKCLLYTDAFNCDRIDVSSFLKIGLTALLPSDYLLALEEDIKLVGVAKVFTWKVDKCMWYDLFSWEFPAIVYNDALISKLDFLTEPTPDDSKSDKDNDDDKIDIKQSSGGNVINTDDGTFAHGSN